MTSGRTTVTTSRGRVSRCRDVGRSSWLLATCFFVAAIVAVGVLFLDTWRILLLTWTGIGTYNYGAIVPFLSLYLVLRMRSQLMRLTPTPSLWGIAATALLSLIWAIGHLAGVLAIQQFSVLALIPAVGLAVFGTRVLRVAAFPFFFLLLALPVGEFFIPQLITWTADFAVVALEFLGIPVYRDGPFIRIPAGDFHVIKACSGIRYLLTSLVLGTLFAYLSFRSWRRRAVFLVICLIVPIVANWLRAIGIILIGHLSDMKLAGGIDHFIYGWVFFGLVMLIIFLIGSRFSEGKQTVPDVSVEAGRMDNDRSTGFFPFIAVFFGVVLAAPAGIVLSKVVSDRALGNTVDRQQTMLPSAIAGWTRQEALTANWNPVFVGARSLRSAEYRSGDSRVSVIAVFYDVQTEGAELIGAQNSLYDPVAWWSRFDNKTEFYAEDRKISLRVREVSVSDGARNRLIWSWYSISGSEFVNDYRAKLATFRALLAGDGSGAYLMALAVDYDHDIGAARRSLEGFLGEHLQQLRYCLDATTDSVGGGCE